MPTEPIPDIGQTWRSAAGVLGEIVELQDEQGTPIDAVTDEYGRAVHANYYVVLKVPGATGPIRIQENTFLQGWSYVARA